MISAFEERIIQEIEIRILRITYRELVTEDGELMVTVAEEEALQPAFETSVKNYRIMEGMGVTFHCRMSGTPLPKVQKKIFTFIVKLISAIWKLIQSNLYISVKNDEDYVVLFVRVLYYDLQ